MEDCKKDDFTKYYDKVKLLCSCKFANADVYSGINIIKKKLQLK